MSEFGGNFSFNIMPMIKNIGKQIKDALNKSNLNENSQIQLTKNVNQNQNKPIQSLVQTNSNIVVDHPTQASPGINQAALNASNIPKTNINQDIRSNINIQGPPSQVEFHGPPDLPPYAGIANMSLKSWIAEHDSNNLGKLKSPEKQLTTTLEGIKGFERQNYEGYEDDYRGKGKQSNKNKNLIILSQMFACQEQSGVQDTELLVNIMNFKKLGSQLKYDHGLENDLQEEFKSSPPLPTELHKIEGLNELQIRYLHKLLTLPNEFPECLRLFAKEGIEINTNELHKFLLQRLNLIQEQAFKTNEVISNEISKFIPLVNQNEYSALIPLVLLYYPLPLPYVIAKYDFLEEWLKKKKDENNLLEIIASCEIFYSSKQRGRFLIKFELNEKNEFSFNIQTSKENNGVIRDLELAIAESMYLLQNPPVLSDLNILLTHEIYKATDLDEELSIFISGSSSKLLSREIATSMRGRNISYHIYPFSFKEFLYAKKFEIKNIYYTIEKEPFWDKL